MSRKKTKLAIPQCGDTNPRRGCAFLIEWEPDWYSLREGEKVFIVMPHFSGVRFNYCPTCGAYIREVKIEKI